jgi:hypothetical protein
MKKLKKIIKVSAIEEAAVVMNRVARVEFNYTCINE